MFVYFCTYACVFTPLLSELKWFHLTRYNSQKGVESITKIRKISGSINSFDKQMVKENGEKSHFVWSNWCKDKSYTHSHAKYDDGQKSIHQNVLKNALKQFSECGKEQKILKWFVHVFLISYHFMVWMLLLGYLMGKLTKCIFDDWLLAFCLYWLQGTWCLFSG